MTEKWMMEVANKEKTESDLVYSFHSFSHNDNDTDTGRLFPHSSSQLYLHTKPLLVFSLSFDYKQNTGIHSI